MSFGFYCVMPNDVQKSKKIDVYDSDGYYYRILYYDICSGKKPLKFSKSNPYVINNINNYIQINHIQCELLSGDYFGNKTSLLWRCSCGKEFHASWDKFYRGKHTCDICGRNLREQKVHGEKWGSIISKLKNDGFVVKEFITSKKIHVSNLNGYKYILNYNNYRKGFYPR